MGKIHRFFEFLHQNWLKFLGCTQNFGVVHLKMLKCYYKPDFYDTFGIFRCKK